jgi:hypothetical protein
LAEGSGSKSTAAKEELPRPTMMDAMDGRLGLGKRQLLRVARREGGREGGRGMGLGRLGVWDLVGDGDGYYKLQTCKEGFLVLGLG